ncbi:HD-GYP domain-containing protein [Clostridium magnum]|uniref:Cyclic di-GMP phosphodiesterase response regulator RpfG n=1 Tax=Clostridium magnum DSM 2767 TaxID=1121326 RepID=A0A162SDB7_9CLOT|nr:HD domain-containing phosphohydrolase [Clostridium magnum]KZL91089.1 cyclic di-GMP phosphodiesterase response regulator RpfG [Clostridium magnum DSM 2767]SHI18395.1 HD domain-containing protein [Clostridium magnum DSM 2767]
MSNTIFLLTNSRSKELSIRNSLSSDYKLHCVTKGDMMVEMYKKNPKLLIIDVDICEDNTLDIIQSILDIEYLPVIYVYSEKAKIANSIKNEILISIENLNSLLMPLIKQSTIFKIKYDNLMESYDAIDLLNGEIKSFLKKYSSSQYSAKIMYKDLLDLVFGENLFLTNKPHVVWVLSLKKEQYDSLSFQLSNNKYEEKIHIDINKKDSFKFDVYSNNGFGKNCNLDEISDISFSEKIFPKAIKDNSGLINNFSGFAIGNLILIGINYKKIVTSYDISIMKALAINIDLIETIKHQIDEIEQAFEYTTNALARAAETNDDQTGKHVKRVNSFAKRIAEELGLSKHFINKLYNSAQMHDVGKIYVDKNILLKPGKLSKEEFEEIKKHTTYGEKIIGDSEYLKMSAEVAKYHHEKYDGTGYPESRKGEDIPLSARIVFIADIYDALRSERSYKPAFSHEKAYKIITLGDGRVNPEHFDPKVLEAFKRIHEDFRIIYEDLKD